MTLTLMYLGPKAELILEEATEATATGASSEHYSHRAFAN